MLAISYLAHNHEQAMNRDPELRSAARKEKAGHALMAVPLEMEAQGIEPWSE